MKLTLGEAKSTIARVIGCGPSDARVAQYINEAVQVLLPIGNWVGTIHRYRFCTNQACITWPRHIESIEAIAICETPGTIHNQWYEFLGEGPGQVAYDDCIDKKLIDRGLACAFDDITGSDSTIRVISDQAEDADSQILLQGYDENNNWIRTLVDGEWIDGEYVTITTTPGNETTNTWMVGGLVRVIKPVTNSVVRLYEEDNTTGVQRALAAYEPDETLPEYRRSLIPAMEDYAACCATSPCTAGQVTVLAKLKFIPVSTDNDFILIGNLMALKHQVMAILKQERNLFEEAQAYEAKAIESLQRELNNHSGAGTVVPVRMADKHIWGPGAIENIVT